MKKLFFIFIICLLILPCLYANNGFRIKDRTFEIGLNANAGFSNDFLSAKDFFQETFVLELDELADNGLRINLRLGVVPLYFSYNNKNRWGFGLSINADAAGNIGFSGNMLTFKQAVDEKSDLNMALFTDVGIDSFFHIWDIKFKLRPAFYYPVIYLKSDISYTFDSQTNGTILSIDYEAKMFTAFSMDGSSNDSWFSSLLGVDFSIGVEYPLARKLGISKILPFFDFDIGIDVINIPLFPSNMKSYMQIAGRIGSSEPIVFFDDDSGDFFSDLFNSEDAVYGEEEKKILRPFKMLGYLSWRPLGGSRIFTIIPEFGFAINPLFVEPFSLEAGVKARLDLANIFITTLGIGYYDRLWINNLDLAFNLRAIELNVGIDLRSPRFLDIWSGYGFGLNLGLKLGW